MLQRQCKGKSGRGCPGHVVPQIRPVAFGPDDNHVISTFDATWVLELTKFGHLSSTPLKNSLGSLGDEGLAWS